MKNESPQNGRPGKGGGKVKVRKAVIPAAGFGTRFLPFTKSVPKELIPLVDKPVIQYVVEEAASCGVEDILMVISSGKEAVCRHFNADFELESRLRESGKTEPLKELRAIPSPARIHYVYQQELDGLGGAVRYASDFAGDEPFAVLLGDTVCSGERPVLAELLDVFEKTGGSVVALERVPEEKVGRYGVVGGNRASELGDNVFKLSSLVEKPKREEAPSNLAIASRYVFTPGIFRTLSGTGRGRNNEVQLTDAMKLLLSSEAMYGVEIRGRRHDIGDKLSFLCNTVEFALRRPEFRDDLLKFLKGTLENC